ncbi:MULTISPECIES: SseB family protein [unclassified Streptomyces]|uniref:SseB family protein n=1 Tax=Streptomyces sp. NBC_00060 TaxID=2975636 RepID=A0AAU2GYF2_9ACTN
MPAVGVGHREFSARLAEFRGAAVLVPLVDGHAPWSAYWGGVRWICAFSDEAALARFGHARREAEVEWTYRRMPGARLLDVVVPALGVATGVALDAGSEDGTLFPPVAGIVPERVAVLDGQGRAMRYGGAV